jgi:uncharacterized membrane protein HdeD (DUF308 family)
LLLLGIAEGVAGAIAIAMPLIGTLVSTFAYGWILLISGVLYGAHALRMRGWRGLAWHSLLALAYIVIGVMILMNPLPGAAAVTLMLAGFLIATGVLRVALAWRVRPSDHWMWIASGGVLSAALGILLIGGWPGTSLWALGLLLGINLVFNAGVHIALAIACRAAGPSGCEAA